jgi:AcrR family transcriptional regulator
MQTRADRGRFGGKPLTENNELGFTSLVSAPQGEFRLPYRHTEKIARHLSQRREAILAAARDIVASAGFHALNMQLVADKAGVAIGTLYRYFPSKDHLCAQIVTEISDRELAVLHRVAASTRGPLRRLRSAIETFTRRAIQARRLSYALMAEPVTPEVDRLRLHYRGELTGVLSGLIDECIAGGALPAQNATATAAFMVGAFIEGVIGPHAPDISADRTKALVKDIAGFCLKGAGAGPEGHNNISKIGSGHG